MIITLIRHGQSTCNSGSQNPKDVGDRNIELTATGRNQAMDAGKLLGRERLDNSIIFTSPYKRCLQTLEEVLIGSNSYVNKELRTKNIIQDPRLREISYGYCSAEAYNRQHDIRRIHGWFYYKFEHGESPANVYDRVSDFTSSMFRERARQQTPNNVTIIGHGTTNRVFVMRFLNLTVDQFEDMDTPPNCGIITIAPLSQIEAFGKPLFISQNKRWAVTGDLPSYWRSSYQRVLNPLTLAKLPK